MILHVTFRKFLDYTPVKHITKTYTILNIEEYNIAVKQNTSALYRYLYKSLRDKDEVMDVMQETFMRFWEHKEKVFPEKAKSWLFTTAYHFMLKSLSRNSRSDSLAPIHENLSVQNPCGAFEAKDVVGQVLDILPFVQKSIIVLRDMEGYDYKEIGNIMNISESQVKVYLFRARQKIKNELMALGVTSL